ncbi:MAG: hypothetical protein ACU0CY_13505 [Maritimibacter harenae]|jgi:Flp pilus assembly protein TadG|nr:hypothetical protein [Maritimibacter harenae]
MLNEIRHVLNRSRATIWQDMAGAAALMIGLVAVLYLPSFI